MYIYLYQDTHEREVFYSDWAENYSSGNPGAPYVQITGGTSGGARENSPTFGRLRRPSQFMLVSVNQNQKLEALQDITVTTNGNVIIGEITDNNYYND